jgi:hypothetical protein
MRAKALLAYFFTVPPNPSLRSFNPMPVVTFIRTVEQETSAGETK